MGWGTAALNSCTYFQFSSCYCCSSQLLNYIFLCVCLFSLASNYNFSSALQLSMKMVPKILSPLVKEWAPQAFVISFKLETDASILLDKARRALDTYRHQAVVANVLDSRRGYVVVVTLETQAELILTEEDVKNEVEIEERIVSNLTSAHDNFITQQVA